MDGYISFQSTLINFSHPGWTKNKSCSLWKDFAQVLFNYTFNAISDVSEVLLMQSKEVRTKQNYYSWNKNRPHLTQALQINLKKRSVFLCPTSGELLPSELQNHSKTMHIAHCTTLEFHFAQKIFKEVSKSQLRLHGIIW